MAPPPPAAGKRDYWWSIIPIRPVASHQIASIDVRVLLSGGSSATATLGTVELSPSLTDTMKETDRSISPVQTGSFGVKQNPLVAICMATYNPPADMLLAQIDSIRRQSHRNWICLISDGGSTEASLAAVLDAVGDDHRFSVSVSDRHLGVYENFERALRMVPAAAGYVALCDQDDQWHAEKLAGLLAGLEPGSRLVYSDAHIVDDKGQILDTTLWRAGAINHGEFATMMLTARGNIPGAAMLFDAALLDQVLPFPPAYAGVYHDFWIARVARALGPVSYVAAPMYDYVQHSGQTLGASASPRHGMAIGSAIASRIGAVARNRLQPSWRRALYFDDYVRVALACVTLELRCWEEMSRLDRWTVRVVRDNRLLPIWLGARWIRGLVGASQTRGAERRILEALTWRLCATWRTRLGRVGLPHRTRT